VKAKPKTTSASFDAERGVLSAILQNVQPKGAFRELVDKDFFFSLHRRLFARLKAMVEDGEPLLLPLISDSMRLDSVEAAELAALLDPMLIVRTEKELRGYVNIVKQLSRFRKVQRICHDVATANGEAVGLLLDLQGCVEHYYESLRASDAPGVLASAIKATSVEWLWRDRIPLGKVTVVDGDPDKGKSLLTMDLVARVTSERSMPDGTAGVPGGAVVLNAEDDASDTIIPRLLAAGANLDRVRILKTVRDRDLEIPGDNDVIREAALSAGARLITIDPLMAFLTLKANSWRDQDVRRALRPLADLAAELRAAIIVVRHLNKSDSEGNPLYRGGGSIGIIGAARAGLLVGADPDDETGETRILAMTKSNLARKAPSLRYRIIEKNPGIVVIEWLGESEHRASMILSTPDTGQRSAADECARFLSAYLEDGARPSVEVIAAARRSGFSERTIDRAKIRARIKAYRVGFGTAAKWMWTIAESAKS
jgi:RecA-family ATPase